MLANTTSRYPEAARPVGGAHRRRRAGGMAAVADAVVERYLHADFRAAHPDVAAALRAKLLRCDAGAYVACCHAVAGVDWLDRLHAIRVPTLVIAGARDVGATPEMAKAIAGAIAGAELGCCDASHLSVAEVPTNSTPRYRRFPRPRCPNRADAARQGVLNQGISAMSKAFASQADLADKKVTFTKLSDNAYAYTAEGDPNTGVVIGDDAVMVIDTQATPVMAEDVIRHIREVTDKPIRYVVMSQFHAVRASGRGLWRGAYDRERGYSRTDRRARQV